MHLSKAILLSILSVSPASAWIKGLNIGAQNPNGACKTQDDWLRAFTKMKSIPPAFNVARLYASSDCGTLANAVPAALQAGVKLLVGVWTQDDGHYGAEKGALQDALGKWPNWQDWMLAISVGSEDLYRNEAPASTIAQKINDVRSIVRAQGVMVEVGHVDTWTAWTASGNSEVIQAADFVGTDGYPYWQGSSVPLSPWVFWNSVNSVKNRVNSVKPGTKVWVTETGWPVSGKSVVGASCSISNAQTFWKTVACQAVDQIDFFWYSYQDYTSDPSFGIVDANDNPLYDMSC